ncbi:STAS domain-containing protein [Cytobacillus sp. FJAT-54145]|uniref:STAS domain-containing protein n=1 Tax=Cytobacillus spartinae TaxID=3299023 RepID=A0ABW6KJ59_9BACI
MSNEYILMLEKKIREYEEIISEMSAPIIPSIIPKTILVPITGLLFSQRFENIRTKVLNYIHQNDTEFAIIDFTDITIEKIESLGLSALGKELQQLSDSLHLMGIKPYYVGLRPHLIKEIVSSGVELKAETYSTFQSALKHLMQKNDLVFARQ